MAEEDLVNWIRKGLGSGYDLKRLRHILLAHGHSVGSIDRAIGMIGDQSKARQQQLADWMKLYVSQGYGLGLLERDLYQKGYSREEIRKAADLIHKPEGNFDLWIRSGIAFVGLVVLLSGAYLIFSNSADMTGYVVDAEVVEAEEPVVVPTDPCANVECDDHECGILATNVCDGNQVYKCFQNRSTCCRQKKLITTCGEGLRCINGTGCIE